jgi:hypothetical protein
MPAGAESRFPNAAVQKIAGAAAYNWSWLLPGTGVQAPDFFHLPAYVSKASEILFPQKPSERKEWTETLLCKIKCSDNGVYLLIYELEKRRQVLKNRLPKNWTKFLCTSIIRRTEHITDAKEQTAGRLAAG